MEIVNFVQNLMIIDQIIVMSDWSHFTMGAAILDHDVIFLLLSTMHSMIPSFVPLIDSC